MIALVKIRVYTEQEASACNVTQEVGYGTAQSVGTVR